MRHRLTTLSTTLILLAGSISLPGCNEDQVTWELSGVHYSQCLTMSETPRRKLDLLYVIDDSSAMAGFQDNLRANLPALMASLRSMSGGPPDLHIGVVSTVLGTAPHAVPGCPALGHAGMMYRGACAGPMGATYIKDVKPSGCVADLDVIGNCPMHTCVEDNCGHEPGTWLVIDETTGCPRCRNYEGSLEDAFACIATVGVSECPFSQPLEAMKQALQNHVNLRFRREDARLGIAFITAQDDCSAEDAWLFDPSPTDLGPLSSFRCFEHGVTCDESGRAPGIRHNCRPRTDPAALLTPPSAYADYLLGTKDPQMLVVTAVTGPAWDELNVLVELDGEFHPRVASSCSTDSATGLARPSIRLHDFAERFNNQWDMTSWAYTSICNSDYTPSLAGFGNAISSTPELPCFGLPLRGCSDPEAAEGLPGDGQTCNDACLPNCVVTDVQRRGMADETQETLPHCLEVCADGACPGNTDPAQAYANGRPVERDYRLPVPACWFVSAEHCPNTGRLFVARQADPPPRTFVDLCCELIPDVETLCDDGLDGDGDCLVDLEDPDCAGEQL